MKDRIRLAMADNSFFKIFLDLKSEDSNIYWTGHDAAPDIAKLKEWYTRQLESTERILFKIVYDNIDVGYVYFDILESRIIELSYAVSQQYTNLGIATAAVGDAIAHARSNYDNYPIRVYVAENNIPSAKVMENNSFRKTGKYYMRKLNQVNKEVVMEEYLYEQKKVFIIAEAGVNHNGNIDLAKKLIDAAVEAKVDAIKFQTWKTELLVTKEAEQAEYQSKNTGTQESQYTMLKRLELSYDAFRELKKYCDDRGIIFLSTPDEIESADFLCDLQDTFKIGSGEITNLPYLRHIGNLRKNVILSTGMAVMDEVKDALDVLMDAGTPRECITVLHANTMYPTPMADVNLKAMQTIGRVLDIAFGYSDHTLGIEVPVAAVAMGATVIEKHFTLDKSMQGPDHKASLDPEELVEMVRAIRNIECALGSSIKKPSRSEKPNRDIVRKSIVARRTIQKNEIFTEENLTTKRPGNGISPMRWDEIIGSTAREKYETDELI